MLGVEHTARVFGHNMTRKPLYLKLKRGLNNRSTSFLHHIVFAFIIFRSIFSVPSKALDEKNGFFMELGTIFRSAWIQMVIWIFRWADLDIGIWGLDGFGSSLCHEASDLVLFGSVST